MIMTTALLLKLLSCAGAAIGLGMLGMWGLPKIFHKKKNTGTKDDVDEELSELQIEALRATLQRNIGRDKSLAMNSLLQAAQDERERVEIELDILPDQITEAEGRRQIAKFKKEEKSFKRPLFVKAAICASFPIGFLVLFMGLCLFAKCNGWN